MSAPGAVAPPDAAELDRLREVARQIRVEIVRSV